MCSCYKLISNTNMHFRWTIMRWLEELCVNTSHSQLHHVICIIYFISDLTLLWHIKWYLPAAAICSLVDIGLKPTNGTCMDNISPMMKNELYAENKIRKVHITGYPFSCKVFQN